MSEQEVQNMLSYIDAHLEDDVISNSTNDMENLRKKARSFGIALREDMTLHELQFRIQYVDRFLQKRNGATSGIMLQVQASEVYTEQVADLKFDATRDVAESEVIEENIDGEAVEIDGEPLEATFVAKEQMVGRIVEEEDDVDGAPMEEEDDIDGAPLEDDVDGVPLEEDIDGAPIGGEDIDGVPLSEQVDDDIDGVPL